MTEALREYFYPLGFLAAFAFGLRMLLQWIKSEAKGESTVMPAFWKLSICGNLLLMTHAFIQVQFHVFLVQACNLVISWRNLNIMQPKDRQITTKQTICLLLTAAMIAVFAFLLQGHYLLDGTDDWFRIPSTPWQANAAKPVNMIWHLIGFFGLVLFSSRFWIQWWCIERDKLSYLGTSFWLSSLIGEILCLAYFLRIGDPVNFIGPAVGLIPYLRNLMLIQKKKKVTRESAG